MACSTDLALPSEGNFSASEYVFRETKSQAVLFAFLHSQQFPAVASRQLVLEGLDGTATLRPIAPRCEKPQGKSSVLPREAQRRVPNGAWSWRCS